MSDFRKLKVWGKSHALAARDLELVSQGEFASLTDQTIEVRRMLYALRTRIVASPKTPKRTVPA